MRNFKGFLPCLLALVLTACGGGSSSSSSSGDKIDDDPQVVELQAQTLTFQNAGPVALSTSGETSNPANGQGSGAITYTTSNNDVVEVDAQGDLVANSAGEATITATIAADEVYQSATAEYQVVVELQAQTLTFQNAGPVSLSIYDGSSNPASGQGSGVITYTSSNNDVIEVDAQGNLDAKSIGEATITATIAADDVYQSATAKYPIIVEKAMRNITVPDISKVSLNPGQQSVYIRVYGYSGSDYTYVSSNEDVIKITNGNMGSGSAYVRAVNSGTATLTFTAAEDTTYKAATVAFDIVVRAQQQLTFNLEADTLELNVDNVATHTVRAQGTGDIQYTSNNTGVIDVNLSTGEVTAKASGYGQITAKISEDDEYTAASASYLVKVLGKELTLISEVTTSQNNFKVSQNVGLMNLNISNCGNGYQFSSGAEFSTNCNNLTSPEAFKFSSVYSDYEATINVDFNGFPELNGMALTEFGGKLWAFAGGSSGSITSNIWNSDDGLAWNSVVSFNRFDTRWLASVVEVNEKLWMVGGFGTRSDLKRDVWSSVDGIDWVRHDQDLPEAPPVFVTATKAFNYNDTLYVLVGANNTNHNALYKMADDGSWQSVSGFSGSYYITSGVQIAQNNGRIIIAANNGALYYSDNGDSWASAATEPQRVLDPNNMGRLALFAKDKI